MANLSWLLRLDWCTHRSIAKRDLWSKPGFCGVTLTQSKRFTPVTIRRYAATVRSDRLTRAGPAVRCVTYVRKRVRVQSTARIKREATRGFLRARFASLLLRRFALALMAILARRRSRYGEPSRVNA